MRYALALILMTLPAAAQSPLSASDFDALTLGKTFTYAANGTPYGAEEYLPDRRVRWSFLDGKCKDGVWWDDGDQICFAYEDNPDPQCWRFFNGPGGLSAVFSGDTPSAPLYEVGQSDAPLLCLGPDVGA